ncbi:hypothetical protein Tco_1182486 [Tanacetum coccineum]
MELVLEQTQQGTSYEVSVSAEGVEELKRKVKIKGEKKEALLTLRQKPEHPNSFTMKMEILLEPTSNKLMVEHAEFDESNTHVLERFYTSAGNPVKEILLKLNLPDHRKLKDGGEVKEFQRSFRHSDTERLSRSDEVLKLKNFKKDATLKLFKSTNQESSSQTLFTLCSTHATDEEVTSIVRSSMSPPPLLTVAVATTIIADVTSAPAPRAGTRQVPPKLFTDSFFVSQDVDSETLHQIYIPKWNVNNDSALDDTDICLGVIDYLAPPVLFSQLRSMDYEQLFVEFNVGTARQSCLGSEVRLRLEHELRGRKKFEDKCAMQAGWLKEKDAEIAMLIEIMPKNIINIFRSLYVLIITKYK